MQWLKAMAMTHEKHEDMLNEIFDSDLRVKPIYHSLIGGLVSPETIATAARM